MKLKIEKTEEIISVIYDGSKNEIVSVLSDLMVNDEQFMGYIHEAIAKAREMVYNEVVKLSTQINNNN